MGRNARHLIRAPVVVLMLTTSVLWAPNSAQPAPDQVPLDGGLSAAKEAAQGAIDLITKLKDLLKKDAKVGVYVSATTSGPDKDDFAYSKDSDLDDVVLETDLDANVQIEAENSTDNAPTDHPYRANPNHYAAISLSARCKKRTLGPGCATPNVWSLISDPSAPSDEVWVVAQDDANEDPPTNVGATQGAAAGLFSEDGKVAEACFQAEVTNKKKNTGKAFDWEKQDVKTVDKEKCSPLRPFNATLAAYFMADQDMFDFVDLGSDTVRIVPSFGPVVDVLHTYWQRAKTRALFPVTRGYDGVAAQIRRGLYQRRAAHSKLRVRNSPQALADFTVVGAALKFRSLDVTRSGRTDVELLEEYFASASVRVVAPEHAQQGYVPSVVRRAVVHSGEDISNFVGRRFVLPSNERRDGQGADDPMVGVLVAVHGDITKAVKLAANTPGHLLYRRLGEHWDGSRVIHFKLTDFAIHHELSQTLHSVYE